MLRERARRSALVLMAVLPLALAAACGGHPTAAPPPAGAAPARSQELTPAQAAYQLLEDLNVASPPDMPAGLPLVFKSVQPLQDSDRTWSVRARFEIGFARDEQSSRRWQSSDTPPDGDIGIWLFDTSALARTYFDHAVEIATGAVGATVLDRFEMPNSARPATCITFSVTIAESPMAGAGCGVLVDTAVVEVDLMQPGSQPQGTRDQVIALTRTGVGYVEAVQAAAARRAGLPPTRPVVRIGWLAASDAGFQAGLRRDFLGRMDMLGYHRGQDMFLDYRFADGQPERLPALAAELVADRVDEIVAVDVPAAQVASKATSAIPIVVLGSMDPVAEGLATSVAHPGGNVTGMLIQDPPEIYGKRLEILADGLPGLRRVAVLGERFDGPGWDDLERVARTRGIELVRIPVATAADIDPALDKVRQSGVQAIVEFHGNTEFWERYKRFQLVEHLPLMFDGPSGGPITYAGNPRARFARAADFVDRIRARARPADLPFERPAVFTLTIDLVVARAWGLDISPTLVARADQVWK
jgi:putative ABC transport system substrate-binding protein